MPARALTAIVAEVLEDLQIILDALLRTVSTLAALVRLPGPRREWPQISAA